MSDSYFRMSVLSAVLELQDQPIPPAAFAEMVGRGALVGHRSYDYRTAQTLDELTDCINQDFGETRQQRLRRLLNYMIRQLQPAWALSIPYGRQFVISSVDDDTRQCLRNAGLLHQPGDSESQAWWDALAAEFRRLRDDRLLEIGRRGEELSLSLETARLSGTGRVPEWVALEDNTAGYDIRSHDPGTLAERPIEVKATTGQVAQFHLTRNEWTVATLFQEQWRLHLWLLTEQQLLEFTFDQVAEHIPADHGDGLWQEVVVRMPRLS